MPYFALPYQILFHDTMAYGSHHFLTNFKFQCVAREVFFFEKVIGENEEVQKEFNEILVLTQEGYARNLFPVGLAEKVAILLTYEEVTRSTLRICFRVVRYDGKPVSCGYQTLIWLSKKTQQLVPFPPLTFQTLNQYKELVKEKLENPSFSERTVAGGTAIKQIFSEEVCALGKLVASAPPEKSYPRLIDEKGQEVHLSDFKKEDPEIKISDSGLVFTFPGQGSYKYEILHEIYRSHSELRSYVTQADKISHRYFGHGILPLIKASSVEEHDNMIRECLELDQVGIYLAQVLIAKILMQNGLKPDVLIGHSFGELAALCVSGAYGFETGLEIISQRVLALQSLGDNVGAMAAVTCGPDRAKKYLNSLGKGSVRVAGVNHARQIVVSGKLADLKNLKLGFNQAGVGFTLLKSRYPFHSSLLSSAVAPFTSMIKDYQYSSSEIPVYSAIEKEFYSSNHEFGKILPSHFIRSFDFSEAVVSLYKKGCRFFIECGGGNVLTKLVQKNLTNKDGVVAQSSVRSSNNSVQEGLRQTLEICFEKGILSSPQPEPSVNQIRTERISKPAKEVVQPGPLNSSTKSESAPSIDMPIAIVSMGCVLPGATDPDEYWRNLKDGISGIVDWKEIYPEMVHDFLSKSDLTLDKTYSSLAGLVQKLNYDIDRLPFSEEEFTKLSKAQQFLAVSLSQSLSGLNEDIQSFDSGRVCCILGSTGDGSAEYDEALFVECLRKIVEELDEPEILRDSFCHSLEKVLGYTREDVVTFSPRVSLRNIVGKLVGREIKTYLLDAACASSLYSIDLGIKYLQLFECDIILAGGVFSAGQANNCLFSQFNGLSRTGSRPFDASADGVVFGAGAAIVALKRLPDAISSGDQIHAVIRGTGISSDGKSASANVPKAEGQMLAMQRAYESSRIDINSIQYIDAHATATPVGDATEFKSINKIFSKRDNSLPPIELSSVKALIGHTGWVAGVAAVIMMCKAFEEKIIPKQHNYDSPNPGIDLKDSPLTIPTASHPWPANIEPYPRRAAVNGFGFGGTNAHLILEAYDDNYHKTLLDKHKINNKPKHPTLAIVDLASLFPAEGSHVTDLPQNATSLRFSPKALHLPAKKRLLPDITDHMDASQYLGLMLAEKSLRSIPKWEALKDEIGVVMGMEGKTGRGIIANVRIYLDMLKRLLAEKRELISLSEDDFSRMREKVFDFIEKESLPSGAYTLIGSMPNLTTGRMANMFDLKGANLVVDMGNHSLVESLCIAELLLAFEDCKIVLAGGINGYAGRGTFSFNSQNGKAIPVGEAALLLALTTIETAQKEGLPILSTVDICRDDSDDTMSDYIEVGNGKAAVDYQGAEGAVEIVKAINNIRENRSSVSIYWKDPGSSRRNKIVFAPNGKQDSKTKAPAPSKQESAGSVAITKTQENGGEKPGSVRFFHTPSLFTADLKKPTTPFSLKKRKVLFLTDQPEWWATLESAKSLAGIEYSVVCPATKKLANTLSIDLSSDDKIQDTIQWLAKKPYDAIIAIKNLEDVQGNQLLLKDIESERGLLDLLFAIARRAYSRLQNKEVVLATLCMNAWDNNTQLNPYTGLMAGFMKSLARELPETVCKAINSDKNNFTYALEQVQAELGQSCHPGDPVEICYIGGERKIYKLVPLAQVTKDKSPFLNSQSVVIATAGARGVTAYLVEELLRRFGCSVIAVGRTDVATVPEHILDMDDASFEAYETQYYKEEMARDSKAKIVALKKNYRYYQGAREVKTVLKRLQALPGMVEYVAADVTDREAIEQLVKDVVKTYGRLDFVIHGAGIQTSKKLPKKKLLNEFQAIISTKLSGLSNLYNACQKYARNDVDFHILTSAFSYMGNDGQPDYGAANETMNRIASYLDSTDTKAHWSTMAWLGWEETGMAKGFGLVGKERGIYPIRPEEGQLIFSSFLDGQPFTPINILMTENEKTYYKVDIASSATNVSIKPASEADDNKKNSNSLSWNLSAEEPFLSDHLVHGVSTVPGAFECELIARAVQPMRPNRKIVAFENLRFLKFAKVFKNKDLVLRCEVKLISEDDNESLLHAKVLSDFIHKNGTVLQKDIVHLEGNVRLATRIKPLPSKFSELNSFSGKRLPDPYNIKGATVRLKGMFECMNNIVIAEGRRRADFKVRNADRLSSISDFLVPCILMDAVWRFSVIHSNNDNSMPVYVPEVGSVRLLPGLNDKKIHMDYKDIVLIGYNPRFEGNLTHSDWIQAVDSQGQILLIGEKLSASKFGDVTI